MHLYVNAGKSVEYIFPAFVSIYGTTILTARIVAPENFVIEKLVSKCMLFILQHFLCSAPLGCLFLWLCGYFTC